MFEEANIIRHFHFLPQSHLPPPDWLSEYFLFLSHVQAQALSSVQLFTNPWTITHPAPLSVDHLSKKTMEWIVHLILRGYSQLQRDLSWLLLRWQWFYYHHWPLGKVLLSQDSCYSETSFVLERYQKKKCSTDPPPQILRALCWIQ